MKKSSERGLISFLIFFISVSSCHGLVLKSDVFVNDQFISAKYTCEGDNISPQLSWSDVPANVQSFAIICDDPDAPTAEPFVHWVIFNIKKNVTSLSENVPAKKFFTARAKNVSLRSIKQGTNNFGKIGYGGPCPPKGHGVHRYNFVLYALDVVLNLKAGATKSELLAAMQGHILTTAKLIGRYERK